MANEKIVTLENLTTYNTKIQDKLDTLDHRIETVENYTVPDARANVL
jgi:uncharacterized protein YdcH (DUF465 family)